MGNWVYFWTQYKSFQLYKQRVRVWLQLPWGSRLMSVIKLAACNYGFEKEVILTHCIINKASREQRLCHYYISIPANEMFCFVQRWDSFLFSIGRSFLLLRHSMGKAVKYGDKFSRMINFKWKKLIPPKKEIDPQLQLFWLWIVWLLMKYITNRKKNLNLEPNPSSSMC